MVVRCFARRAVIAVRRPNSRSFSKTSLAPQDEQEAISSGSATPRSNFRDDFFSSTTQISHAFARHGKGIAPDIASSTNDTLATHPLVKELLFELHDEGRIPSPNKVWSLYHAIHQSASTEGPSSSQVSAALTARDHQSVLRAISRKPRRQAERQNDTQELVKYRYRGALLSGSRKAPEHVSSYLQRVLFIFAQLKQSEKGNVPSIIDYDTVLERLAPGGNMPALSALWAHLTGSNTEDFSIPKASRAHSEAVETQHRPSQRTYLHLMMGISRHLSAQIERLQKQVNSDEIWKGQGKRRQRKADARALAASRGQVSYGQQVNPQVRRAVRLASARTMSLLEDMIHRQIKPVKITLDLAMRMLRMDGNIQGIKVLLKAFGVDLENPDADARLQAAVDENLRLSIDVHTLNTLLMALGEQSTVSEMITAYETLTRPLKSTEVNEDAVEEVQGNLFATDWRGIFKRDIAEEGREEVLSQDGGSLEEAPYKHPLAILPNTTTLTVMIRHCCNAPDSARMVAGMQKRNSKEARIKQDDHESREEGDYLSVAFYILSEAIALQEQETVRMASQIGVDMPSIDILSEKVEMMLEKLVEEAEKPIEADKEGFFAQVLEESKEEIVSSFKLPDDFVPHYLPPALGINYDMIQPIVKHISRRRTADFARWRWLVSQVQRVISIKIAELQVIHQGIYKWEQVREASVYGPHLSNEGLKSLVIALRKQRRMVRTEILVLSTNLIDRIMKRFAALRTLRRSRRIKRLARNKEERLQLLQVKVAEEEKKQKASLQRQQAREDREALQQQDEVMTTIPAVEPVYK
jgi:hypothetical protein